MARTQFKLTVGALVNNSFGIYFRNFVPFVLLGALVFAPWIALQFLAPPETEGELIVRNLVNLIVYYLSMFVLTGALTYGVVQQLRGQPAGIAQALSQGLKSFTRVLGTSMLCGARIILFSLLLLVPGIIEMFRLYVAIPAAVMEGKDASSSVARSNQLTEGSRMTLFGGVFVMSLLTGLVGAIIGFVYATSTPDFDPNDPWLSSGIQVVFAPLGATLNAVAYFLLRKGKENVDAKEIAAVFD